MTTRKPVFDGGGDRRTPTRGRRANPRKTMQLCAQVRRALDLALMGEVHDEVLQDLSVDSVEPTADDARLLVVFGAGEFAGAHEKGEVMARLDGMRSLLVEAVAEAISRRKVPEMAFEVVKRH